MAKQAQKKARSTKNAKSAARRNSDKPQGRQEIGKLIRVDGVKMPGTKETATVSFKEMTDGRFRAKPHGHPAVFVNLTEKGAKAHIRGKGWHEARSPEKAFAMALADSAKKKSPATERAGKDGGGNKRGSGKKKADRAR